MAWSPAGEASEGRHTVDSRIARVFPRRTAATPTDELSFIGGPGLFPPEVDAVHVSVAFSWDMPRAEELAREWAPVAPVSVGGPAMGEPGGDFTPGLYLKHGYVITSRGCPNRCWFCTVPSREGDLRELPISDGWNLLDDNILACSDAHIKAVFAMLRRQPHPAEFTGGIEAARLREWHVSELCSLRLKQLFLAYDEEADFEHLHRAAGLLRDAGLIRNGSHIARCYVLIGYPGDTEEAAEERCHQVAKLGIMPMAMLYRAPGIADRPSLSWRRLQRQWANPVILGATMKATLT